MIDMDAVAREIRAAHAELDAPGNVKGILSLGTRMRIWQAMDDPADPEAAYRHRVVLKMLCVRRVQHYWDRAFPGDTRVEEMLTLAQAVIDQQVEPNEAERQAGNLLTEILDEIEDFSPVTEPASFVADAASGAVASACHRNPDYDTASTITDDDRRLPDSLESSYSCASAAAGALNWQPVEETDVPARKAFWTWYLDEAIPQALAS